MSGVSVTVNAVTKLIDAQDIRFACRELGPKVGAPLVLCHRFRGTMDDWDPALIDALAKERHVVLFDNAGVGLSTGAVPSSIKEMADRAAEFITLMGFEKVDLLGFSMGGYVAQIVTLDHPQLVRKLVLAGTGPGGGAGIQLAAPEVRQVSGRPVLGLEEFLYLFFSPSAASRAAAERYWARLQLRGPNRAPPVTQTGVEAQVTAIRAWSQGEGSAFPRLPEIEQRVFVANGNNDVMVPTINSFLMAQRLRNSLLIVYPDSGHGFLFQYLERFVQDTLELLRSRDNMSAPDIASVCSQHLGAELFAKDVDATMATMTDDPYVNHVPTMTGGVGVKELRRFYAHHFITVNPDDMEVVPVSRTVGEDRIVEETVIRLTHSRRMDYFLPGVAPTHRMIEVLAVVVAQFRDGKLAHEHIYWDQASVLVQAGLLDVGSLPIAGVEVAHKVLDPELPSNALMFREWAESEE